MHFQHGFGCLRHRIPHFSSSLYSFIGMPELCVLHYFGNWVSRLDENPWTDSIIFKRFLRWKFRHTKVKILIAAFSLVEIRLKKCLVFSFANFYLTIISHWPFLKSQSRLFRITMHYVFQRIRLLMIIILFRLHMLNLF